MVVTITGWIADLEWLLEQAELIGIGDRDALFGGRSIGADDLGLDDALRQIMRWVVGSACIDGKQSGLRINVRERAMTVHVNVIVCVSN